MQATLTAPITDSTFRTDSFPARNSNTHLGLLVFSERLKGVFMQIVRREGGDTLEIRTRNHLLLELNARELSAQESPALGALANLGVQVRGYSLSAFVYDHALHIIWDSPRHKAQGVVEKSLRAARLLGSVAKLKLGGPAFTRLFVSDGDFFTEVFKGPAVFKERRVVLGS